MPNPRSPFAQTPETRTEEINLCANKFAGKLTGFLHTSFGPDFSKLDTDELLIILTGMGEVAGRIAAGTDLYAIGDSTPGLELTLAVTKKSYDTTISEPLYMICKTDCKKLIARYESEKKGEDQDD